MTPEIRDCPQRLTAMERKVVPLGEIGHAIGSGAADLRRRLLADGAEVRGAP